MIHIKNKFMNKENLNTFINLIKKKSMSAGKRDLGLIVKETNSEIDSKIILEEIQKILNIEKITYNESVFDDDIIENLIEIFQKEKWLFLEIKKDISSLLLNQLKHLTNHNVLQLLNYKGEDLVEIKMPENSGIIVFAERDFIENKINYPYFYKLFGPTLSL